MKIRQLISDLSARYRWSNRSNINSLYRYGLPNKWGDKLIDHNVWSIPGVLLLVGVGGALLSLFLISVPFTLTEQFLFSLAFGGLAMYVRRYVGTLVTLVLICMSLIVSTRYIYWRLTETFGATLDFDMFFGVGLIVAELYAWLVLVIGFFQTIWPLKRKPIPMPEDTSLWPSVDIFIPSYNEPLSVVRPTVIAALALDWPRDKLKVYILDDGRRDEFREFADSVGVTHVIRSNNFHAKAGNINAALPNTHGELIAIFDCDHIPTRSFLQMSVGWFLADKKLAMVQTPHHFLSPDPFLTRANYSTAWFRMAMICGMRPSSVAPAP
jgi:cellulose synthase (UDP-forming)